MEIRKIIRENETLSTLQPCHLKPMATLHLLCGFIGSGKTTFATKLEQDIPAVRFSPDEWIVKLYGSNPPATEFQGYYNCVADLIWQNTFRLLSLGLDVVLDFGFWSRASRDEARTKATEAGASCKLYFLDCPEEIMRRRVLKRTEEMPEGTLWINAAAFDLLRKRFEPLGKDENHIRIQADT